MSKISHYYFSHALIAAGACSHGTGVGKWQGCAQLAYERTDGNGTHHVRGRRVYTLPIYPTSGEADAAAQRLARQQFGATIPAVNDNGDPRDESTKGAQENRRHG